MDDEQYRQTRDAINSPPCLYGKAVQYGYFSCQYACNITLGEREARHCESAEGHANCKEYFQLTLMKSGFALGKTQLPAHLTFNKAMQVQIGGLQGAMTLSGASDSKDPAKNTALVVDIADCFSVLKATTPDFTQLDFSRIVPFIQKFSLRKRSGVGRSGK